MAPGESKRRCIVHKLNDLTVWIQDPWQSDLEIPALRDAMDGMPNHL
jgi:hypothetical protein